MCNIEGLDYPEGVGGPGVGRGEGEMHFYNVINLQPAKRLFEGSLGVKEGLYLSSHSVLSQDERR